MHLRTFAHKYALHSLHDVIIRPFFFRFVRPCTSGTLLSIADAISLYRSVP